MPYRKLFPELYDSENTLQVIGGVHADACLEKSFSVLVWNVYKGRMRGWEQDFRNLIEGKQIVMLQESVMNTRYDPIFQTPEKFEWVLAKTFGHTHTKMTTGVKTGAVVKSTAQGFYISEDMEPLFRTPKMILATTYPIKGSEQQLLTVNMHAINFVSYEKFSRHMAKVVIAIENHEGPVILAGDFNTWSSLRYKRLQDIAEHMGLTEVKLSKRRTRLSHFNRHLDHLFYKGLELVNAEMLTQVITSDHFPITAEFKIL